MTLLSKHTTKYDFQALTIARKT